MVSFTLAILLCCAGGLYFIKHLMESYRKGILYQTINRVFQYALRIAVSSVLAWAFLCCVLSKSSPACELGINLTSPESLDQIFLLRGINPQSNLFPFFLHIVQYTTLLFIKFSVLLFCVGCKVIRNFLQYRRTGRYSISQTTVRYTSPMTKVRAHPLKLFLRLAHFRN